MADIRLWLQSLGLGRYADTFEDNDVDFRALRALTEDDLKELGVSLGHRRVLQQAISELRAPTPHPPGPAAGGSADSGRRDAERRQLTVMFCDLVGSTSLSASMDPERYREILAAYQAAVQGAIDRYEGYIARYMGDGLLVYFGYPQAHEEDSERAVRAGLDIVDSVDQLEVGDGIRLQVRIGIATGLVVAGDIVGTGASEERAVLGDTPNLAARLQNVAGPNTIVISESTRRLVQGRFDLTLIGPLELSGFAQPVSAHRVDGIRVSGRFEASSAGKLAALAGRDEELAILSRRWRLAREGEGQVVLLGGEPGIGKSRLVRSLFLQVQMESGAVLRYDCSPYHRNSAFYPVVQQLQQAAGIARGESPEVSIAKLEALIGATGSDVGESAPFLAALLALPLDRYPPLDLSADRQKAATISALVAQLAALSRQAPTLVVLEDAHWLDPSSMELFRAVIEASPALPVLIVVTHRPGFDPGRLSAGPVTGLSLSRLSKQDAEHIVERVAGGKAVPTAVVEQILEKAEGIPLFVEELTKTVLESGVLLEGRDGYPVHGTLPRVAVPDTLHDSLMARLDRLGAAKEIAQTGAVLGRSFSFEVIAGLLPMRVDELTSGLDRLVEAELVSCRGTPPEATYQFQHALVRDAAYGSLLIAKRQELHARTAGLLQESYPDVAEAEPELVAWHFSEAGLAEDAAGYWEKAGVQAVRRSEYVEALAHMEAGLAALASLPESVDRSRQALRLETMRADALVATRGFAATETLEAYHRARELCTVLGNPDQVFPVLRGIFNGHRRRGEHDAARTVAFACLEFAERRDQAAPRSLAHRMIGQNAFLIGEPEAAYQHSRRARELLDLEPEIGTAITHGADLRSAAEIILALSLSVLGRLDTGLTTIEQGLRRAEELGHGFNLALMLYWMCFMRLIRREYSALEVQATALLTTAREYRVADFIAAAETHLALSRGVNGGSLEQGLECVKRLRRERSVTLTPFLLGILSSAQIAAGDLEQAEAALNEALELTELTGERWSEPELYRLQGDVRLGQGRRERAEERFRHALQVARSQRAPLWELRSATALARLLSDDGEHIAARQILAPVYGAFTEGFDTLDLREASALLEGTHG